MVKGQFGGRLLTARMWRQNLGEEPFHVWWRGSEVIANPGDYIDCEALLDNPAPDVGPVVTNSWLCRQLGIPFVDEDQVVVGITQGGVDTGNTPIEDLASIAIEDWGELIVAPGAVLPMGEDAAHANMAALAALHGLDVIFASSNLSEPCSLPLVGERGSRVTRLPGGRSVWELADQLWETAPDIVLNERPDEPIAMWVSDSVSDRRTSEPKNFGTSPRVWGWRNPDKPFAGVAPPISPSGSSRWGAVAKATSFAINKSLPAGRPPVVFYTSDLGPWGGVSVLFSLADELQRLGVHAKVMHRNNSPHFCRPLTPPLRVPNRRQLATQWRQYAGEDAFLVASHWGAGETVSEVSRANPDVTPLMFLQDREDMFEPAPGRKQHSPGIFDAFLRIGEGVSVAWWIVESAAKDLGLNEDNFTIVQPGIDLRVFNPDRGRRGGRRPRVLAMWRPQTAKRRGIDLLRRTYDHLHKTFGDKVSLELFGWAGRGEGAAPDYATHHGPQSPEGVARLMASVDIVVEPSKFQGFGLPGLEAMACGAALVSTKCRGVDEYAVHGENALVVDHDELHLAIEGLIGNPTEQLRLGHAGVLTAQNFSWPKVAARWAINLAGRYRGDVWGPAWADIDERARETLGT